MSSLRILGLQVENFKRLQAVTITPDGNLVEVRGKNGQGKTSVLDSIFVTLAGKGAAPSTPIRKGTEEARIRLDLGEIIVTRTFRHGKDGEVTTQLAVTAADGAKYGSPQSMLDKLVGSLSFDPLAFSRLEPKQQFDQLKKLVPAIDFDAIQRQHDGDMERRKEINRQATQARAAANVIVVPTGTPAEPIDESALVAQLDEAGKANAQLETRKANRARAGEQITAKQTEAQRHRDRAAELRAQADQADKEAAAADQEAADLVARLAAAEPLPEPVDTSALRAQIEQARITNANVKKAQEKAAHLARAVELEKQSEQITATIHKRQEDKQAAIAAARLPVPGISFGDGQILLNDVPFLQASSAEQLRASIAIAAAMNSTLRVILVRDGSLLDKESLELVAQFAQEHDLQVWAEIVDSTGATGIVIEDGMVKASEAEQAA